MFLINYLNKYVRYFLLFATFFNVIDIISSYISIWVGNIEMNYIIQNNLLIFEWFLLFKFIFWFVFIYLPYYLINKYDSSFIFMSSIYSLVLGLWFMYLTFHNIFISF